MANIMASSPLPPRPATPQVLLHRLPSKPSSPLPKPSRYIVLIMGNTTAAGKQQIARSVAAALSAPFFHGDQVHRSSAKAATVGSARHSAPEAPAPNTARYRRMWLSKMTRTGLLFPDESRPATEGFAGGGSGSEMSSRRGSVSSVASATSSGHTGGLASGDSEGSSLHGEAVISTSFPEGSLPPSLAGNALFTVSEEERRRRENPVLMVLTHTELKGWHKTAIRTSVGEYGIGVVFVPLYEEEEATWVPLYEVEDEDEDLPVLKPFDPRTMTGFPVVLTGEGRGSEEELKVKIDIHGEVEDEDEDLPVLKPFDPRTMTGFPVVLTGEGRGSEEELKVKIDIHGDVETKTRAIIEGVRDVVGLKA